MLRGIFAVPSFGYWNPKNISVQMRWPPYFRWVDHDIHAPLALWVGVAVFLIWKLHFRCNTRCVCGVGWSTLVRSTKRPPPAQRKRWTALNASAMPACYAKIQTCNNQCVSGACLCFAFSCQSWPCLWCSDSWEVNFLTFDQRIQEWIVGLRQGLRFSLFQVLFKCFFTDGSNHSICILVS